MKHSREGTLYLLGFIATIYLANFLISHVGTQCVEHGPCTIPVGFGLVAPSGVLAVGLGFTLRDLVQRKLGVVWTIVGIVVGAVLSAWLSPALALASGAAFLLSETLDLVVYTPLQRRHFLAAVLASNVVGAIADSAAFLLLAFGSLDFVAGQVVGKLWMTALALPVVLWLRKRDEEQRRFSFP